MSVEDLQFGDQQFDLVYAYATMEHVPAIEQAFSEMARVTKPGGVVYSHASPLWRSPFGHHKANLFPDHPWIHLLMSAEEIIAFCAEEGIDEPSKGIEHHVRYMLNPAYFNMRPASDYVAACDALEGVDLIANSIAGESPEALTDHLEAQLAAKGIGRDEALAVSHTLIARRH
jgi:ubiquinone/menaquinone biosynthesis C-methylase UbiE